jgi:hypothetical protein
MSAELSFHKPKKKINKWDASQTQPPLRLLPGQDLKEDKGKVARWGCA